MYNVVISFGGVRFPDRLERAINNLFQSEFKINANLIFERSDLIVNLPKSQAAQIDRARLEELVSRYGVELIRDTENSYEVFYIARARQRTSRERERRER